MSSGSPLMGLRSEGDFEAVDACGVVERAAGPLPENPLVERFRLRLGVDVELSLQDRDASLILPERCPPPSLLDIQSHQGPVGGLLQGIECEQSQHGPDSGVGRPDLTLVGEEPGQRL